MGEETKQVGILAIAFVFTVLFVSRCTVEQARNATEIHKERIKCELKN